jgi:hypothetical protein
VHPALVYIYFNLLALVGGFFVVNLILAVINEKFIEENEKKHNVIQTERNIIDKLKIINHNRDDPYKVEEEDHPI